VVQEKHFTGAARSPTDDNLRPSIVTL